MKLSVLQVTYNHEAFIEQSVRSVLAQKTNFDFEIVIGEDCSTDRTRTILDRLVKENPGQIRVIRREQNIGMQANFIDTYSRCTGTYLAILDGDDFWTDPTKLQKQVDWLDAHPDHSFCFHNVTILSADAEENGQLMGATTPALKDRHDYHIFDLIRSQFIPSCSVVMRRDLVPNLPDWILKMHGVDWFLTLFAAAKGPFSRLDECMAVYRKHAGGAWTSLPEEKKLEAVQEAYKHLKPHLPETAWPMVDAMTDAVDIWRGNIWYRQKLAEFVEIEKRWREEDSNLRSRVRELEGLVLELEGRRANLMRRIREAAGRRSAGLFRRVVQKLPLPWRRPAAESTDQHPQGPTAN
jgi:glycosyltransferase involved in cell wall biosynthesis